MQRAKTWIGAQLASTQTLTPGIREFTLGSKPNHLPGAWPVPRGIRGVRPLADAISIGRAPFLAVCHAVLGHSPRV